MIIRTMFALAAVVLLSVCKDQAAQLSENAGSLDPCIKALITYDSTNIYIKMEDTVAYQRSVPNGFYLLDVFYDRMTGLISYNKCHPIEGEPVGYRWTYELVVWDYLNNKSWLIDSGCTYDGEGANVPHMCNYNPATNSGIRITYGWESLTPYKFINGRTKYEFDLPRYTITLLAVFNDDSILVHSHREGFDLGFFSYNYETRKSRQIDTPTAMKYYSLILGQVGINIHYYDSSEDWNFWNSDWNPKGNAVVYHQWNEDSRKEEYFYYCTTNNYKKLLSAGTQVIPIWKSENATMGK